jgi:hypothetical protein
MSDCDFVEVPAEDDMFNDATEALLGCDGEGYGENRKLWLRSRVKESRLTPPSMESASAGGGAGDGML